MAFKQYKYSQAKYCMINHLADKGPRSVTLESSEVFVLECRPPHGRWGADVFLPLPFPPPSSGPVAPTYTVLHTEILGPTHCHRAQHASGQLDAHQLCLRLEGEDTKGRTPASKLRALSQKQLQPRLHHRKSSPYG